jgi:hypothetical protein
VSSPGHEASVLRVPANSHILLQNIVGRSLRFPAPGDIHEKFDSHEVHMILTDREDPVEFILALGPADNRLSITRIGEIGQDVQRMR